MENSDFAWTIEDSTKSPGRIDTSYLSLARPWIGSREPNTSPSSTSRMLTTTYEYEKETNGKRPSVLDMAYMSTWSCPSEYQMPLRPSRDGSTESSNNTWTYAVSSI